MLPENPFLEPEEDGPAPGAGRQSASPSAEHDASATRPRRRRARMPRSRDAGLDEAEFDRLRRRLARTAPAAGLDGITETPRASGAEAGDGDTDREPARSQETLAGPPARQAPACASPEEDAALPS